MQPKTQARKRRVASLALLLILVGLGTALAGTPTERSRAWAPFVRLASGREADAEKTAVPRIKVALTTFDSILHGFQADQATSDFFTKVLSQLEGFDLEALHETLPEDEGNGWHRVRFMGHDSGTNYTLRRAGTDEPCTLDRDAAQDFGDLAVTVRSSKAGGEKNDDYLGDMNVGVGLGTIAWSHALATVAELISIVEGCGPGAPHGDAYPSPDALAEVKADNPKCGAQDLPFLALYREAFPKTYEHLRKLFRIDGVTIYDPDDDDYTQVHLVFALRQDAAKANYPAILDWLSGMGPLAEGRLDLTDAKGRYIGMFRFSSKDMTIMLDCFVSHGKVCPVEEGKVMTGEAYDVEAEPGADHYAHWSFDMEVNGIVTEIHGLAFHVQYARLDDGMKATFTCNKEPSVYVQGSAYGIVPTWAIDVFIPGNMQELTKSFFQALVKGNNGAGLVTGLEIHTGKQGQNVAVLTAEAEGLNNFLVRLGFKIARKKLIPPDDAVDEIAHFLRDSHAAFEDDFAAFAGDPR